MEDNTAVITVAPAAPVVTPSAPAAPVVTPSAPAAPAVTPEHISALHRHLDEIGHALKVGFEAVIAFVKKEAPAVEAGAAAIATAVPGLGPVAKVVEAVAGEAAVIATACANLHGKPCLDRSCPNFKGLNTPQ